MADGSVKITIEADGNKAIKSAKDLEDVFDQLGKNNRTKGLTDGLDGIASHAKPAKTSIMDIASAMGLVKIASSAFEFVKNGLGEIITGLNESSSTWQTFEGNMKGFGKTGAEITKVKKELQSYAQQTIYSASDMASTYAQLSAVGTKNTTQLVEGFGGLAAAAEDPQQAMKSLSQQATQMAAKPKVAWEDFKIMLEQSPAGMSAVAKAMGMSLTDLVKKIQDGSIKTDDFFNAISKAGTNDSFGKMATQYKTLGDAMDGLVETMTNRLQPIFDKLSKTAIGWVSTFTDSISQIKFEDIGARLTNAFSGFVVPDFSGISDNLGSVFNNIKEVAQVVFPIVANLIKSFWNTAVPIFSGLVAVMKPVADFVGDFLVSAFNELKPVLENVSAVFVKAGKSIGSLLTGMSEHAGAVKTVVAAFAGFAGSIAVINQLKKAFTIFKVIKSLAGDTKLLGFALKNLANSSKLAAVASKIYSAATKAAAAVQKIFNAVMSASPIGIIVTLLATLVAGLVYFFTQTETGKKAWQGFMIWLGQAWANIKDVAVNVWNSLAEFFTGLWNGIKNTATTVFTAVATFFSGIWNGIKNAVITIWTAIATTASNVWNGIKTAISNIVTGVKTTVSNIFNVLSTTISGIWNAISSAASTAWNTVKDTVVGIAKGLMGGVKKVWDGFVGIVTDIVDGIGDAFDNLGDIDLLGAGKAVIDGFVGGLKKAWEKGKKFVEGIANWIIDHKGPIRRDKKILIPAGKAIIGGLNNGMVDKFKTVKKTIGDVTRSITNSAVISMPSIEDSAFNKSLKRIQNTLNNGNLSASVALAGITPESASGVGRSMMPTNSVVNNYVNNSRTNGASNNDSTKKAVYEIHIHTDVDGHEIAKTTATYTQEELDRLQKQQNRMRGDLY